MYIHEYQVKQLFVLYDLPIPTGYVLTSSDEVEEIISKISTGPWIVKCQIHAGGRSKSGGIRIVKSKEEMYVFIRNWLSKRLITNQTNTHGQLVNYILVEKMIDIVQELYIGIIIDYASCRLTSIASIKGGIDVETSVKKTMNQFHKVTIDPLVGPMPYQGRELAFKLGLKGKLIQQFTQIFINLVTMFLQLDLILIEINPLAITHQNDLICLDGKLNADDNALFRQSNLYNMRDKSQMNLNEFLANQWKMNYIKLNGGNIGLISNGAGLAMATMDTIQLYGGKLTNFLDISGNVTKEHIVKAFEIILSEDNVAAIIVNIFGGIVCCNVIADGIIYAIEEMRITIPIVVRMEGNNNELSNRKLINKGSNIFVMLSLIEAIKQVINLANGKQNVHFNR